MLCDHLAVSLAVTIIPDAKKLSRQFAHELRLRTADRERGGEITREAHPFLHMKCHMWRHGRKAPNDRRGEQEANQQEN